MLLAIRSHLPVRQNIRAFVKLIGFFVIERHAMRSRPLSIMIIVATSILVGCSTDSSETGGEGVPSLSFDDFMNGKADTAYYSNKAAELELELTSRVYQDLSDMSPEGRIQWMDGARSIPSWKFGAEANDQPKYARNQLGLHKLKLNLEQGEPQFSILTEDEKGMWANYTVKVDSIMRYADLQKDGLSPKDLVGRKVTVKLPKNPNTIFALGGMACATDPDGDPLEPEHINASNYFYYFDPFKEGCPLKDSAELIEAVFELRSSADTRTVWPEFDRLAEDGQISMMVLFGQIEYGDLKKEDKGWVSYTQFISNLAWKGFEEKETFAEERGKRFETEYYGGLKVGIDVYSPKALARNLPSADRNALFKRATNNYEIVHYDGHSSYGTLDALEQPEAFLPEKYQIVFMDGCESYSYYTKQIFKGKINDKDPTGQKYVDVVNNVEPSNTGSHTTALELWLAIFEGADAALSGHSTEKYSWNHMIDYMNLHAEQRAKWHRGKPELYGASGVKDNCFTPDGDRCTNDPPR
jgi:hypothetical protein